MFLGPSLNLSQHTDVEQDRGKRLCYASQSLGLLLNLSQHIDVEQDRGIGVDACALGPSLNLSQHIDVEQDRGRRLCFGAFSNLCSST